MNKTLRTLALTALLAIGTMLQAQNRDYTFSNTAKDEGLTVENASRSALQMRHSLKQMSLVNVSDNGYTGEVIQAGKGIFLPANAGEPNLPATSRFVAIPNGANARVVMGYRSMTTIQNVDLMAAAPIPFDTDDTPNTYEKDHSIYDVDAFYPAQPVTVSESFSLRGVEAVALTVIPYQYNPVTKELRVYDDLQFSVEFEGGNGEFGDNRLRSPYWDPILMQNLVNYDQLPQVDYEARMQEWVNNRPEGCEYLIVIPNNEGFRPYANQLKDFRVQQGIITEVMSLSEMGCNSTDQMKTYFHNAYNNWAIPPVAVLLLGDHNSNMSVGIPAEYTYHSYSYGNCITDNGYADVTGDNLPEMAFSRLVAANATEAQMMVSKQLEYEYTAPNMNASTYDQPITALGWQTERWFQICSEVVGGYWRNQGKHPVRINEVYQGTPGSIWSSNQNTSMVVNYFGPNGRGYIPATPSELGGWNGGTASQVVQSVNNGCMLLQHRDHGYYQGWGEPSFSNSNVSQMNNTGKLTFVNTINCQTGTFDYNQDCLIEAFMRRTYNGQNAGAVGCIGPTQTSYSFVNDAYAWGMYDQYDPQFMPDYGPYAAYSGNWQPAFGNVAGKYFLQQSSWPYNASEKAITHKMFTAHCDAFLRLYTQVPTSMSVSHPSQISPSNTSMTVSAPAGAVIALSRNGNVLAVATATGSSQSITFPAQPANSDITIAATKQDKLRYVGSIHVISEPCLAVTEITLNDANGNGQLEYGENASFDISIKNTGNLASTAGTATLSTTSTEYVTITNSTTSIPALTAYQSTELTDVFGITIANNVPHGTRLNFTITMTGGSYTWHHEFSYSAFAPALHVNDNMTVNDGGSNRGNGNGRLDPGETAQVTFVVSNNGGATAQSLTATLTTASQPYITISNPSTSIPNLGAGDNIELSFDVTVAANMPLGEAAGLTLNVVAGAYATEKNFSQRVGLEFENFANGLEALGWVNDEDHPWTLVTTEPYSGTYCLQSGNIGNGQSSSISMPFNVENETDEIRFVRKVDCQQGSDYLRFYIDDEMKMEWSGILSWREMVVPVTQGEHTFTWTYIKDATGSSGNDCAWIDNILFPVRHYSFTCNAGDDQDLCVDDQIIVSASASGFTTLAWSTDGDGTFGNANALSTNYIPGEQDLERMNVTLTFTITNEAGETLSDEVVIRLHERASITMEDYFVICKGYSFISTATVTHAESVAWTTDGDGIFDDGDTAEATYYPGEQDLANGTVTLTLTATGENGCDATASMQLGFAELYSTEVQVTACDSYEWEGETYTESGYYQMILSSSQGCDSIVHLDLTVNPSYWTNFMQYGCDSFEWEGNEYTESGHYDHLYTSINGCDSLVTMHLFIESVINMPVMEGPAEVDSYLTPSTSYIQPGYFSPATYQWSLEPAEAGELTAVRDSVNIVWNENFKGEATVRIAFDSYCGAAENSLSVMVKNSYDVSENGISAHLYPNPTTGRVTIEAAALQRLTVSNALGQVVFDAVVDGDNTELNLAPFGSGVYVVRIVSANGTSVQRVMVE